MVRRGWETDPFTDPAAADVLAAYEAASEARLPAVACYRAGVEAWHRFHPDQKPTYAAQRAVAVILAAKASLRIPDE
jgi:hypothetical protein